MNAQEKAVNLTFSVPYSTYIELVRIAEAQKRPSMASVLRSLVLDQLEQRNEDHTDSQEADHA